MVEHCREIINKIANDRWRRWKRRLEERGGRRERKTGRVAARWIRKRSREERNRGRGRE